MFRPVYLFFPSIYFLVDLGLQSKWEIRVLNDNPRAKAPRIYPNFKSPPGTTRRTR